LPLLLAALLLANAGAAIAAGSQRTERATTPTCGPGFQLEPSSGACAPVIDRREAVPNHAAPGRAAPSRQPPSLFELRSTRPQGGKPAAQGAMPPPGGIGVGATYETGDLPARTQGELYTRMLVHPDGVRATTTGLDWLFTTATNRVEQGVEVVGIYFRDNPNGDLGVFDWSCSPGYPCQGGITGPAWIWTRPFAEFACNLDLAERADRHLHRILYYVNAS
jgi:hypothetical protein